MKLLILSLVSLGLFAVCSPPAVAAPIAGTVATTFDSGLEGWTASGSSLGFSSTIGNPAGSALFTDNSGGTAYLRAPAPFLGDWSLVKSLQFDHKIIRLGEGDHTIVDAFHVVISGPGGAAVFDTVGVSASDADWVTVVVPLEEASWNVTGNWNSLLNDVTDVQIPVEMVENYNNSNQLDDQDAIDNVVLSTVPEPTSVLLVSSAVIGLLGLRRKARMH